MEPEQCRCGATILRAPTLAGNTGAAWDAEQRIGAPWAYVGGVMRLRGQGSRVGYRLHNCSERDPDVLDLFR